MPSSSSSVAIYHHTRHWKKTKRQSSSSSFSSSFDVGKRRQLYFFRTYAFSSKRYGFSQTEKRKRNKKLFLKKVFVSRTVLCSGIVHTVLARLFILQTSSIHWIGKGLSCPFHSSDFESFKRGRKVVHTTLLFASFFPERERKKPALTSGFSFCIGTELLRTMCFFPPPLFPPHPVLYKINGNRKERGGGRI